MRTNWVTVVIYYLWTDLAPIKNGPTDPQQNLRVFGIIDERSDPPRCGHGAPSDEDEILHTLDIQSHSLCKGIPTVHIVSDVVLEHLLADNIFAEAILRKRQKCSLLTLAAIRSACGTPRQKKYQL
jgi:hypothetical protein